MSDMANVYVARSAADDLWPSIVN